MRRQVDYHLAHARAAASGARLGARSAVAESAAGLVRTLTRLHAERPLTLSADVLVTHFVRVERQDLDEMLGNLLDNACKWARLVVRVSSTAAGDQIEIIVDDDGPGLAPELPRRSCNAASEATRPRGSGFGLAIVCDLGELYTGSIALEASPMGGLRARLTLPAAN